MMVYTRSNSSAYAKGAGDPGVDAFELAWEALRNALEAGHIGQILAMRVVAAVDEDHGRLNTRAARILEAISAATKAAIDQLTAFGGAERGQIATLARFASGAMALVSVGARGAGSSQLGVAAWGSHGALAWYHDAPSDHAAGGGAVAAQYREWIAQSLQTRQTVHIRDGRGEVHAAGRPAAPPASPRDRAPRQALKRAAPPYGVLLIAGDKTHQDYFGPEFAKDPRCRVVGLADEADITPERRRLNEALATRMGIPVLPDLDQALRRDDVQIASITAETSRCAPLIRRAAVAGKHLYLDNYIAETLEDAQAVAAAIREANVVSQSWGIADSTLGQRMRAAIAGGSLGNLAAVHQDYGFGRDHPYLFDGPGAEPVRLGRPRRETGQPRPGWLTGSHRELAGAGGYALVRLLSLTRQRVARVRATTGNFVYRHHQAKDVEDFAQVLLEFDGGLVATLTSGLVGRAWYPAAEFDVTFLLGERAGTLIDGDRPRVDVWNATEAGRIGAPVTRWFSPISQKANDSIGIFLDCVAAGREPEGPAWRIAEALVILIAAYRSAASGEVVSLPLPRVQ